MISATLVTKIFSTPLASGHLRGDQSDGQVVGKFVRRAMLENRFISKLKR